jgi:5-methylcytosine-specific restriction enzyme A
MSRKGHKARETICTLTICVLEAEAPGCPELVPDGKCEEHRVQQERWRGSSTSRGYDYAWQQLSAAHKRRQPLCVECLKENRVTAADDVDHIVPFKGLNDPLRLDPSNLQSLCRPHHHNVKTKSLHNSL